MATSGRWADDLVTGATASFLVSIINVYTVNLHGEWSKNTYTPRNHYEGSGKPELNLKLKSNHYKPLIANTLAGGNANENMIYKYASLPQSLYDRVDWNL
jgi:hypothetical protein